jgi:hypothetical protein
MDDPGVGGEERDQVKTRWAERSRGVRERLPSLCFR